MVLRLAAFVLTLFTALVNAAALDATAVQVATGETHACLLTAAGGVKCWGDASQGQVGYGDSTTYKVSPTDVVGLQIGVIAITAAGTARFGLPSGYL